RLGNPELVDYSTTSPEKSGIFIVEEDSVGGIAKQGCDQRFQALEVTAWRNGKESDREGRVVVLDVVDAGEFPEHKAELQQTAAAEKVKPGNRSFWKSLKKRGFSGTKELQAHDMGFPMRGFISGAGKKRRTRGNTEKTRLRVKIRCDARVDLDFFQQRIIEN
ncbi:hypothetical protein U1Q18_006306, partial [Sarracenia purpurea var. burkii]